MELLIGLLAGLLGGGVIGYKLKANGVATLEQDLAYAKGLLAKAGIKLP
jgi:hypothetical protein